MIKNVLMFGYWLHAAVNSVDNLVPPPVKRFVNARFPRVAQNVYLSLTRHTSDDPVQVLIQSGPLGGRRFVCSLRQSRSYFLGNHDPLKVAALSRYVTPGSTVIDCGGHIGYISLILATLTGEAGRVIVLEPNPANLAVFRQNLALNLDLAQRIDLRPIALSGACGTAGFIFEGNTFVGHLTDGSEATSQVSMVTMDELVEAEYLNPSLLKIDIEGGETTALLALGRTLARCHPSIVIEVHDENAHRVFLNVLREFGYVARRIYEAGDAWSAAPPWLTPTEYEAVPRVST